MTIDIEFRPLNGHWPRPLLPPTLRSYPRFDTPYERTLDLMEREVAHLEAKAIVIQLDLLPAHIRNDGYPRSNAPEPGHPGVIVAFDSKWGPLRYMTDEFRLWKANFRAIALSLEALRKVDRYGVSNDGEQYRGYRQLGDGSGAPGDSDLFSPAEAARILIDGAQLSGNLDPAALVGNWVEVTPVWREAAKRLHPDAGGSDDAFALAHRAFELLRLHHGQP